MNTNLKVPWLIKITIIQLKNKTWKVNWTYLNIVSKIHRICRHFRRFPFLLLLLFDVQIFVESLITVVVWTNNSDRGIHRQCLVDIFQWVFFDFPLFWRVWALLIFLLLLFGVGENVFDQILTVGQSRKSKIFRVLKTGKNSIDKKEVFKLQLNLFISLD